MRRLMFVILLLFYTCSAWAWGQKGHDITAYIAECHLTSKTAKRVARILDGHSLGYYSNWMDNASHSEEYRYTSTWHYANIDEGHTFESMPRNERGDVVAAVEMLTDSLKRGGMSHEAEQVCLKMLIHLVGDLHCPMHAGHRSDLGGNRVNVKFFGKATNLHSVWDGDLVEAAHRWSYTEWQREIDRCDRSSRDAIVEGGPKEWFCQTAEICMAIYRSTPTGSTISYDYIARYTPTIEQQFRRGGYRLAHLLNEIYGK